jgi:predicted ATPase/transcriptional regulator with XRE-family HTH domain
MHEASSFGVWLKEQRHALDLSQAELAQQTGCSASLIYKIEAGVRRPSRQVSQLLATRLGIPLAAQEAFVEWARGLADAAPYLPEAAALPRPTAPPPRAPLPIPLTAFVGRVEQVSMVRSALWRAATRLVTLTGPPGIGKTRLAVQVAASLSDDFTDGVRFVSLAPVLADAIQAEPALVTRAIADALGVRPEPDEPLRSTLKAYLWDKQMLLIVDNFEHLLPAAVVIAELMSSASQVKMLVTSRAALRVRGEKQIVVPPLALPDLSLFSRQDPWRLDDPDEIGRVEGIALFLERAQDVRSDFALTAQNVEEVATICSRLEGIPLAIELAAAQVKYFSLQELLSRLSRRLELLEEGYADLPPHQRTLRAAVAWSYNILGQEAQRIFRRLGVFVGGCSLEAALAVCAGGAAGAREGKNEAKAKPGAPVALSELLNHSLVQQSSDAGEMRLTMLETIHDFALEQLEQSGEAGAAWEAHVAYYRALAEEARARRAGPEEGAWLTRLEREHDNLRAALAWAIEHNVVEQAVRLGMALWRFWSTQGYTDEGRRWFARILSLQPLGDELRAQALVAAAGLAYQESDYAEASLYYEGSLPVWTATGNRQQRAEALRKLGAIALERGELPEARASLEQSLALYRELGDVDNIARSFRDLGVVAVYQRDLVRARRLCEESLALWQSTGRPSSVASAWLNLGATDLEAQEYVRATESLLKSLELFRELGNKPGCFLALANLGAAAHGQGDYALAARYYSEALSLQRITKGSKAELAECLERVGRLAGALGQPERAARLGGAASALRVALGIIRPPAEHELYERHLALIRAELGEAEFAGAWSKGQAMSLDQALDFALLTSQADRP